MNWTRPFTPTSASKHSCCKQKKNGVGLEWGSWSMEVHVIWEVLQCIMMMRDIEKLSIQLSQDSITSSQNTIYKHHRTQVTVTQSYAHHRTQVTVTQSYAHHRTQVTVTQSYALTNITEHRSLSQRVTLLQTSQNTGHCNTEFHSY